MNFPTLIDSLFWKGGSAADNSSEARLFKISFVGGDSDSLEVAEVFSCCFQVCWTGDHCRSRSWSHYRFLEPLSELHFPLIEFH